MNAVRDYFRKRVSVLQTQITSQAALAVERDLCTVLEKLEKVEEVMVARTDITHEEQIKAANQLLSGIAYQLQEARAQVDIIYRITK